MQTADLQISVPKLLLLAVSAKVCGSKLRHQIGHSQAYQFFNACVARVSIVKVPAFRVALGSLTAQICSNPCVVFLAELTHQILL